MSRISPFDPILSFFVKELSFPLELGLRPVIVLLLSLTFFKEFFLINEPFLSLDLAAKF